LRQAQGDVSLNNGAIYEVYRRGPPSRTAHPGWSTVLRGASRSAAKTATPKAPAAADPALRREINGLRYKRWISEDDQLTDNPSG
jgi:hypothetical protein